MDMWRSCLSALPITLFDGEMLRREAKRSAISSFMTPDFAHSLTHSLLNQPLPLQPQNIPLPASAIKSRKERATRSLTIHGSDPASATSTPQGAHPDIRMFDGCPPPQGHRQRFLCLPALYPSLALPLSCFLRHLNRTAWSRKTAWRAGPLYVRIAPVRRGEIVSPLRWDRGRAVFGSNAVGVGTAGFERRGALENASSRWPISDIDALIVPAPGCHVSASCLSSPSTIVPLPSDLPASRGSFLSLQYHPYAFLRTEHEPGVLMRRVSLVPRAFARPLSHQTYSPDIVRFAGQPPRAYPSDSLALEACGFRFLPRLRSDI